MVGSTEPVQPGSDVLANCPSFCRIAVSTSFRPRYAGIGRYLRPKRSSESAWLMVLLFCALSESALNSLACMMSVATLRPGGVSLRAYATSGSSTPAIIAKSE